MVSLDSCSHARLWFEAAFNVYGTLLAPRLRAGRDFRPVRVLLSVGVADSGEEVSSFRLPLNHQEAQLPEQPRFIERFV